MVLAPHHHIKSLFVFVKQNQEIDIKLFFKQLVNIHYNRNDMILEPGTFRLRGDVIELFQDMKIILLELNYLVMKLKKYIVLTH